MTRFSFKATLATNSTEGVFNLILLVLTILILLMLLVSVMLMFKHRSSKAHTLAGENTRIYILYIDRNIVREFDMQNLGDVKEIPLFRFYEQFEDGGVKLVESWIKSLLEKPEETRSFLETHIRLSKSNKKEFVLLEMTHADSKQKIIHLESHLLPRLTASSSKHSGRHYLVDFETLRAKFVAAKKIGKKKGVGCLLKVTAKQNIDGRSPKYTLGATAIQLVNVLTPYLKETRFICLTDTDEIFVFDTEISTRSMFFSLANELTRKIEGYLAMNSLDDEFAAFFGAAMFDPALESIKVFIARCREMASLAEKDDETEVALYEENSNKISNPSSRLYSELSSIIHNRSFRYYFTPIISALGAVIYAYKLDVVPYGSSLESFDEVVEEAQGVSLLAPIGEIVVADSLRSVKAGQKVVLDVTLPLLKELLQQFSDTLEKPFILALNQSALDIYDYQSADLSRILGQAHSVGFSLALSFDEVPSYPLDEEVLRVFDAFFIEDKMSSGLKNNERARTDLRLMLATYSPYDKPIAVFGLETINDLEVAFSSGVKFFTCSDIANASSALEGLSEKRAERVISMSRRLN